MATLFLDQNQIDRVKSLAREIADEVQNHIDIHSSVSVERTLLRLYGVDGVDEYGTPLPNKIVQLAQENKELNNGISAFIG